MVLRSEFNSPLGLAGIHNRVLTLDNLYRRGWKGMLHAAHYASMKMKQLFTFSLSTYASSIWTRFKMICNVSGYASNIQSLWTSWRDAYIPPTAWLKGGKKTHLIGSVAFSKGGNA